ncbi:MAG: hydantoinase/oxoprolinase family protein [Burkholderiaceae bacterium]
MNGSIRIAIDIGGTFTDIQLVEESTGRTASHKTPTTPDNPATGLVAGIQEILTRTGSLKNQISGLMHGTTIATNAILQRRFPRAALLTTSGFEDVLEIGRHVRREIYSQVAEDRPILIPRRLRFGVDERVDARGQVVRALDRNQVINLAERLQAQSVEVVAVCFLNSFKHPDHENSVIQWLTECLPNLKVSASTVVSPEAREYERLSTTVLNALLMPVVSEYLEQLRKLLLDVGIHAPVYLVQSNGGVTTPEIAAEQPVRLILSGPSGGARAVEVIAAQMAMPNLIAIDMGGTSFDVSVIRHGRAKLQTQGEIDSIPVRVPMLEIRTIGAGGGSLAQVDSGRITVGPQSAGAQPGPVAYGRGGEVPTVTDANIALGRIDPDYFLGGSLTLDVSAAAQALKKHVADPLGLSAEQAASGVVEIAVSHMSAAIRLSLFEKGLDPEDFALVSFGGAGGLHAALVAEQLGSRQILFPADAGTQSAWGMLFANVVHDVSTSCLCSAELDSVAILRAALDALSAKAVDLMDRSQVPLKRRRNELTFDMRYPGQGWELSVPCFAQVIEPSVIARAVADFHRLHKEQFAHHDPLVTPEVVTLRVKAIGEMDMPSYHGGSDSSDLAEIDVAPATKSRSVYVDGHWQPLDVINRKLLRVGVSVPGPVIVEDPHSTILLTKNWLARLDGSGTLVAEHISPAGKPLCN